MLIKRRKNRVLKKELSEQDIQKQPEKQNGKSENNPEGCMRLETPTSAGNGSAKLTRNSAPSANCKADVI